MIGASTIKEDLEGALKHIEAGWCQGAMAQDKVGNNVSLNDPAASRFCALGALRIQNPNSDAADQYLRRHLHASSLANWNDDSTQKLVIKGFKSAIRELETILIIIGLA